MMPSMSSSSSAARSVLTAVTAAVGVAFVGVFCMGSERRRKYLPQALAVLFESAEARATSVSTMEETYVPDNANAGCVGVDSKNAGKAAGCAGCPNQDACSTGEAAKIDPVVAVVAEKLKNVKRKILVLSGKGGVGKSTVTCQLGFSLSQENHVGLLDIDICGPSLPFMLGVNGQEVHQSAVGWSPVYVTEKLGLMSIGFMLPNEDDAIIWRGPRKNGLIRQFLTDVAWGELDYLIVDTPPGTSDEHMAIIGYLDEAGVSGAIIVTSPQEVALTDVRKEVNFCKKTGIPILGVVENMKGFLGLDSSNVLKMCKEYDISYLGSIPLDVSVGLAGERGSKVAKKDIQTGIDSIIINMKRRIEEVDAGRAA